MKVDEFHIARFDQTTGIEVEIAIETGPNARSIHFKIPIEDLRNKSGASLLEAQLNTPIDITPVCVGLERAGVSRPTGNETIFLFRNRVYHVSGKPLSSNPNEEATLCVKRFAYLQDRKLQRLRSEVEALERLEANPASSL